MLLEHTTYCVFSSIHSINNWTHIDSRTILWDHSSVAVKPWRRTNLQFETMIRLTFCPRGNPEPLFQNHHSQSRPACIVRSSSKYNYGICFKRVYCLKERSKCIDFRRRALRPAIINWVFWSLLPKSLDKKQFKPHRRDAHHSRWTSA